MFLHRPFSPHGVLHFCHDSGRLIGLDTRFRRVRLDYYRSMHSPCAGIFPCAQPLPTEIGLLTNLRRMTLGMASSLPREISNLKLLEQLRLEGGPLQELPREIGDLQSLVDLTLENLFNLEGLPAEIDMLENLS